MTVETFDPSKAELVTPTIIITDSAATQVKVLMDDMDDDDVVGLRIFVQGGGCSGFQYGFTFEETISDEDAIIEQNGIKFIVDDLSYQYLVGSVIDFKSEAFGSKFEISNPNANTTCGCGSSFSA